MDLNAGPLRAFLKVAEHGSFTRAATELMVSQPALSARIRELERQLGFQLFERTSRRVELTRHGRSFLVSAKRVVLETDWMHQRSREIEKDELQIAVQHHSVLMPERVVLTDGFQSAHPAESVKVLALGHSRIYQALNNYDVDIAFIIEPSNRVEISPLKEQSASDFDVEVIARKTVGLLASVKHPLAQHQLIDQAMLAGEATATLNRTYGGAIASAMMRFLLDADANVLRPPEGDAISVMRYASLHRVLGVDLGWFEVPRSLDSLLRPVEIRDAALATELLIVRRRRDQRPAAELFWSYVMANTHQQAD